MIAKDPFLVPQASDPEVSSESVHNVLTRIGLQVNRINQSRNLHVGDGQKSRIFLHLSDMTMQGILQSKQSRHLYMLHSW